MHFVFLKDTNGNQVMVDVVVVVMVVVDGVVGVHNESITGMATG